MHDLAETFHSLQGTSLPDLKRNFNKLLGDISRLQQNELDTVISQIAPRNLQQHFFYLIIQLRHGTYTSLEHNLFLGNKYVNKKLTGNLNFLKQLSQLPPTEFCERICPKISYISRIRIINRLPDVITDAKLGEAYFEALKKRYGIPTASRLIMACGEDFISNAVEQYGLKFNDKQLIKLHKIFPNFAHVYINDERNLKTHEKFAKYLARKDPIAFNKLVKHGISRMGLKASLIFVKHNKHDVLNNPNVYKKMLRYNKQITKMFTIEESIEYFTKILPDSVDDYYFQIEQMFYLEALPLKLRGHIYFTAFKNKYGREYDDYFLNTSVLDLITVEERKRFKLDEHYIQYMTPDIAIPLIKEKIRVTNELIERSDLLNGLVETCKHNSDHNALLEILQYFTTYHKNEVDEIQQSFFKKLMPSFKLHTLSEQHWKYINDILTIFEINDNNYYSRFIIDFRMHYKYLNSLDFTEDIPEFFKYNGIYGPWRMNVPDIQAKRKCIIKTFEYLEQLEHDLQITAVHPFFDSLIQYNRSKNSDPINIFKYKKYINMYFQDFRPYGYKYSSSLRYMMTTIPQNSEEEAIVADMIKEYFDICIAHDADYIGLWFLKNKPDILANYAAKYFDSKDWTLKTQFYYEVHKVPAVAYKFSEVANTILASEESSVANKSIAFRYVIFEDGFFEIAAKLRPCGDCMIDIHDNDVVDKLTMHKGLLNVMRYAAHSQCCIPEILNYCKGDYVTYGIKSLRATMCSTPQQLINAPIETLMHSFRGYAISLAAHFGTSQHIRTVLREPYETEININVSKIIFKLTFKGFAHYPDDDFFTLLQTHIKLLNKNDTEGHKLMLEIDKIPKMYQASYMKHVWEYVKAHNLQFKLMDVMKIETWNKLMPELCEAILKCTLFNKSTICEMSVFVYEYLLRDGDLEKIYNIDHSNEHQIFKLLQDIISKVIEDSTRKELRLHLVTKLLDGLQCIPVKHNKYPLQNLFECCKYLLEIEGDILTHMVNFIVRQQNEAVKQYGLNITNYYGHFALQFMKLVASSLEQNENQIDILMLEIAMKIADSAENVHTKQLALHVLPRKKSKDDMFMQKRKQVLERILNNCDISVDIFLASMYFTDDL